MIKLIAEINDSKYLTVRFPCIFYLKPIVKKNLPLYLAKSGSCMNPLVFAFSHPRYREELARLVPSLGIG